MGHVRVRELVLRPSLLVLPGYGSIERCGYGIVRRAA